MSIEIDNIIIIVWNLLDFWLIGSIRRQSKRNSSYHKYSEGENESCISPPTPPPIFFEGTPPPFITTQVEIFKTLS